MRSAWTTEAEAEFVALPSDLIHCYGERSKRSLSSKVEAWVTTLQMEYLKSKNKND